MPRSVRGATIDLAILIVFTDVTTFFQLSLRCNIFSVLHHAGKHIPRTKI